MADDTNRVLGVAKKVDRLGNRAFWITSDVTLRNSGEILGTTELENVNSVFGFSASVVIALVDADKRPLYFAPINTWGMNACYFHCPKTRGETWTYKVPAADWQRIHSDVHGIAVIQRSDPSDRVFQWLLNHKQEAADLVKQFAKIF